MSTKRQQNLSPDFLFHIAKGFYDTGYRLAKAIKEEKSLTGFQRIAPAVVNFSFAVELLLKGLHSLTTDVELKSHQFWILYKQLPDSIKTRIESKYQKTKLNAGHELTKYRIKVNQIKDSDKSENPDSLINDNSSIEDLLNLHNDSFNNWRYLYELNEGGFEYEYDFRLMNAFAKALVEIINEIKSTRKPSMYIERVK
jgi:hypothetical protein